VLVQELAGAFQQREELRGPICAALERMVLQVRGGEGGVGSFWEQCLSGGVVPVYL
jgi:hypothetical protein